MLVMRFDSGLFFASADALEDRLRELATNYDIELRLTRVKPEVKKVLRRDGVIDSLGESQIYGNVYEAVADQIPDTAT